MEMKKLHIVGHNICPYVQRVNIVLQEKSIPYTRTDIELDNKPQWLTKISPTGKVPVLIVDEESVVFESSVICEYVDELSTSSLYPNDLLAKALHRSWIAFGTEILNHIATIIYSDNTMSEVESSLLSITTKLDIVEQEMSSSLYFSGSNFCLIDAVFATIFRYFDVIESLLPVDFLASLPKVNRWSNALTQRPSVKNAVPDNYNALLAAFIHNKDSYISRLEPRSVLIKN